LVLAIAFVIFSLATTLLSFEVNPISQVPADCFTGRVELLWSTVRVSAVLLVFAQAYITPIGALTLFIILQGFVLAFHVKTFPFHSHGFNMLRAGIFSTILWAAIASVIVSTFVQGADTTDAQWALIALAPVSFFAGVVLMHWKKVTIMATVKRLRAEFTKDGSASTALLGPREPSGGGGLGLPGRKSRRDPFLEFFDSNYHISRGFESSKTAHAAIRILLYEKDMRGEATARSRPASRAAAARDLADEQGVVLQRRQRYPTGVG
jgi:hypothetical protein